MVPGEPNSHAGLVKNFYRSSPTQELYVDVLAIDHQGAYAEERKTDFYSCLAGLLFTLPIGCSIWGVGLGHFPFVPHLYLLF